MCLSYCPLNLVSFKLTTECDSMDILCTFYQLLPKNSLFLTSLCAVFRCSFNSVIFFIFWHFKFREITLVWHVIAKVRKANHSLILTCAAGGGPWPGAISLAQPDAGALKVIIRLTTYAAGCLKVAVANVLDEEAIFWWGQHWAVHHWVRIRVRVRGEERSGLTDIYIKNLWYKEKRKIIV